LFLENLTFYGRALKSVAFAALVHKAAGEMWIAIFKTPPNKV
jgi:hypothetical protein